MIFYVVFCAYVIICAYHCEHQLSENPKGDPNHVVGVGWLVGWPHGFEKTGPVDGWNQDFHQHGPLIWYTPFSDRPPAKKYIILFGMHPSRPINSHYIHWNPTMNHNKFPSKCYLRRVAAQDGAGVLSISENRQQCLMCCQMHIIVGQGAGRVRKGPEGGSGRRIWKGPEGSEGSGLIPSEIMYTHMHIHMCTHTYMHAYIHTSINASISLSLSLYIKYMYLSISISIPKSIFIPKCIFISTSVSIFVSIYQ